MKYILITGAAGFIGSNLIKYFLKYTNYEIIALDNLLLGRRKYIPDSNRCIFRKVDITSENDLRDLEFFLKSLYLWYSNV